MINHHRPGVTVLKNGDGTGRNAARCPVCLSSDRIEKASSVVRTGRGSMLWMDGEVAQYETEIAQLLAEPTLPRPMPAGQAFFSIAASWLAMAAVLGVVALLRMQEFVDLPELSLDAVTIMSLLWFGLASPGIVLLRYSQLQSAIRDETPRWQQARERWMRLYYCGRDDIVFIPQELLVLSPERVADLLYPASESLVRAPRMDEEAAAVGVAG